MHRTISFIMSLLTATLLFAATAASAATGYQASLAEAPGQRVAIVRGAAWVCNGDNCTTDSANSRPSYVCLHVARELGQVTGFSVNGEAFTAEELAACNESAS